MTTPNDGGQAFPHPEMFRRGYIVPFADASTGMTLRDWFAGQALVGGKWATTPQQIARGSYIVADAMIAESQKGKP